MKQKLKNAFLTLSLFISLAIFLTRYLKTETFPDGDFYGLIMALFLTPLIIHVWNKVSKKFLI